MVGRYLALALGDIIQKESMGYSPACNDSKAPGND